MNRSLFFARQLAVFCSPVRSIVGTKVWVTPAENSVTVFDENEALVIASALPQLRLHPLKSSTHRGRRVPRVFLLGLVTAALALGCSQYPESEYPSSPPEGVTPESNPVVPAPPGAIWRRDIVETLDAGLGYFLQRVEVEAELVEDSFIGFRVMALRPRSWWQGIDIAPGDIITRVNAMPIEQPAEAHAAFESLRTASEFTIVYLRAGQERQLRYQILAAPVATAAGDSAR